MAHPKRRTWTLGTLDRDLTYRLTFDPDGFRWECEPVGTRTELLEDQGGDVASVRGPAARKRSGAAGCAAAS